VVPCLGAAVLTDWICQVWGIHHTVQPKITGMALLAGSSLREAAKGAGKA